MDTLTKYNKQTSYMLIPALDNKTINHQVLEMKITYISILEAIARFHNIPVDKISSDDRYGVLVEMRRIFSYLCRKHLPLSFNKIGRIINRDHATVINNVKVCKGYMLHNRTYKEKVEQIENNIYLRR